MGLPRYLTTEMNNEMRTMTTTGALLTGFNAGYRATYKVAHDLVNAEKKGVSEQKVALDIVKWLVRCRKRRVVSSPDLLTREKARLYVGIDENDFDERPEFRDVHVPRYFQARLEKWNAERETRDRDAIDLRLRISVIRRRIFASRTFPQFLKAIIFERDNYTCQICLRGREVLRLLGLHLECDHIVAWEDDGLTTYDNGQTICSECNKAKHHSKRYLGLVAHLNRLTR